MPGFTRLRGSPEGMPAFHRIFYSAFRANLRLLAHIDAGFATFL
jgi:hypothetical protein